MSKIAQWFRESEIDAALTVMDADCEQDESEDELPLQDYVENGTLTPEARASHAAGQSWQVQVGGQ